jgi:hypothetical protein
LTEEALQSLDRLAESQLHPLASAITRVRSGRPAEQILSEAEDESVDLIILPTFGPSLWNRLSSFWKPHAPLISPLAEKIIRDATCAVFVALARKRFDCTRTCSKPHIRFNGLPDLMVPARADLFEPARCRSVRRISPLTARRMQG